MEGCWRGTRKGGGVDGAAAWQIPNAFSLPLNPECVGCCVDERRRCRRHHRRRCCRDTKDRPLFAPIPSARRDDAERTPTDTSFSSRSVRTRVCRRAESRPRARIREYARRSFAWHAPPATPCDFRNDAHWRFSSTAQLAAGTRPTVCPSRRLSLAGSLSVLATSTCSPFPHAFPSAFPTVRRIHVRGRRSLIRDGGSWIDNRGRGFSFSPMGKSRDDRGSLEWTRNGDERRENDGDAERARWFRESRSKPSRLLLPAIYLDVIQRLRDGARARQPTFR